LDIRDAPASTRNIIFLLSPRVIDFDTYLPIGMELKTLHPDWDIHFITFSAANLDFIRQNPILMSGLEKCGTLHFMGATSRGVGRWLQRARSLMRLTRLIADRRDGILFHGRHFAEGLYRFLFLVNRFRGGRSYILPRSRLVDQGMHELFRERFTSLQEPPASKTGPFNGWTDGLVYYHDEQPIYLQGMRAHGPLQDVPQFKLGLPQMLPSWQRHIEEESSRVRGDLASGGAAEREIIAVIATKLFASETLRTSESVPVTFELIMTTLRRLRPNATILVRPHPLAVDEPYLHETLERMDDPNISITFLHPELLDTLASRVIINAPTNLIFTSCDGCYIDCSDYREEDLAKKGNMSFGAGYGAAYVNPNDPEFEGRFAALLDDDEWQKTPRLYEKRRALAAQNPPAVDALIDWMARPASGAVPVFRRGNLTGGRTE
tara:strand:- start:678 stop:1982 length:1305 start_codon:yes stop_codon:yes gene_type:complete